jgi:biotin carboxyl carrier protein
VGKVGEPVGFEPAVPVQTAHLLQLYTIVLSYDGFTQAATGLATALAERLHCERVALGWREGRSCAVVALSHTAEFDARLPLLEKIGAAMDEAVGQAGTVLLPSPKGSPPQLTLVHSELAAAAGGRAICTVLLAEHGQALGAITLERASPFAAAEVTLCEDAACLAALVLSLKRRAQRSWAAATRDALREAWRSLGSPRRLRGRLALGAAALACAAALAVPVSYHVTAPARLEGSVQRALVAPMDGYLAQVNVRPGDSVVAGQVLAELATEELGAERLKRESELAQYENVYKAALARADRTQFVVNQAKAAEAQAQLALIDERLERSRLRAPFDGLVIKGDLLQQVGAPVQRGEVLLTLAPGARYRLIVEVDEREVAFVHPGLAGRLALAAAPELTLGFTVTRVLPVALSGEGRNYFEVEAALDVASASLRPGLHGVAKIAAGEASLAWIASHRVLDWLRLAAWSLGA